MERYMLNYLGLDEMSNYVNWDNILYDERQQKLVIMNENLKKIPMDVINIYGFIVKYLDCSFNSITDLYWTHFFRNLQTLILDSNQINDSTLIFNSDTVICPQFNVKTLSLNSNELNNLTKVIDFLAEMFPNLEHLSLHKNPICPDGLTNFNSNLTSTETETGSDYHPIDNYDDYKDYILKSFPNLKFLDHKKIEKPFYGTTLNRNTRILKFSPKMLIAKLHLNKEYSPLPINNRIPGDHCGKFDSVKYQYIGRNSEGNRFISNNDL